jgi:type I restriction enzyme S subunit
MTSEWQAATIGDVCDIYDGPHATPPKIQQGNIFLGISSLGFDGRIDPTHFEYVDDEHYRKWTRRIEPQPKDIVFSYETKLGVAAIIPKGFKCCLGRRMGLLRPNTRIVPEFLLWYFLSPPFQTVVY